MRLAQEQGAKLACFERTVAEARGVLHGAVEMNQRGDGWKGRPQGVAAFFYESGMSVGTMNAEVSSVESRMKRLRIEIESLPDPNQRRHLQINEDEVEAVLNEGPFPYVNPKALHHDSRVLAAMVQLRNHSAQDRFEESRAVFVTGNFRVVRAGRRVPDLEKESWPVAMHVNDVAVLLWIKAGSENSDLPSKQLLATCLSILRPSEATWAKYVAEIEQLEARGVISDADVALIAQRNEQVSAALIASIDESGELELRSAEDLLATARAEIAEPINLAAETRVSDAEASVALANTEAQLATAELSSYKSVRIQLAARRAGRMAVLILLGLILLVTAAIAILSALIDADLTPWLSVGSILLQVGALMFKFNGSSIQERLQRRLQARWLRKEGIELPKAEV